MTDPTDPTDDTDAAVEERLRRDLPRLADTLVATRPTTSDAPSTPTYADGLDPRHDHGRRRVALLVAAAVVAVLAIGAAILLTSRDSSDSGVATIPEQPSTPAHWTDTAPAPFDGALDAAAVWTGEEVLLFGGHTGGQVPNAEQISAAYSPVSDTWRQLAEPAGMAPVVAATWAGDVAVVTAKTGGSVYDPGSDSWRDLPPVPPDFAMAGRSNLFAQAVWTGSQLFVPIELYTQGDNLSYSVQLVAFDLDTWTWASAASTGMGMFDNPVDWNREGPTPALWADGFVVLDPPLTAGGGAETWVLDPDKGRGSTVSEENYAGRLEASKLTVIDGTVYRVAVNSGRTVSVSRLVVDGWEMTEGTADVDNPFRWELLESHEVVPVGKAIASPTVAGGDDEVVILGLTGRDERPPLEFDTTTNTWREPISEGGLSWTGRTAVWADTQVFEWGGRPDAGGLDVLNPLDNTGRLWTPATG